MEMEARVLALNPRLPRDRVQRGIDGGERYAAQFDRLPLHDRDVVVFYFAAYTLAETQHARFQIRRAIDAVLSPHYPGARTA